MSAGHSRRTWGWHTLADDWAARIVANASVRPGELLFDIGARVIAVELHPRRAHHLRARFAGTPVTVLQADALTLRWPHRPFRVVASPSYATSTALLRTLLAPRSRLVAADLVLRRALVRRYTDSRHTPRRWITRAGLSIPRHAFRPMPHVDSAVLVIRRR